VHFRQAAEEAEDGIRALLLQAVAAARSPLRLTEGKKVFEIRPGIHWNKGSALRWIQKPLGPACVLYVGDDTTDEDAFVEVSDAITVRVGVSAPTAARFVVEDPAEVWRFLKWLLDQRR